MNFQQKFEELRQIFPEEYDLHKDDLVIDELDIPIDHLDDTIEGYDQYLFDEQSNLSDEEFKKNLIEGMFYIQCKYSPEITKYKFIENILHKLNMNAYYQDGMNERLEQIFHSMIVGDSTCDLLNHFSKYELEIYGW